MITIGFIYKLNNEVKVLSFELLFQEMWGGKRVFNLAKHAIRQGHLISIIT